MAVKRTLLRIGIQGYRLLQRAINASSVGVKGLVINKAGEILLVEHTYCDGWFLPGGGVKTGETPFEALKRELDEETGLDVLPPPDLFGIYYQNQNGINDYPILFIVKHFIENPIRHPNLEIERMAWFSLDKLPSTITNCTQKRLDEVFSGRPKSPLW